MPCEHKNVEDWDCGCSGWWSNCQSCHIAGKCLDCGASVTYNQQTGKPKVLTGPSCDVCRESFSDKGLLRQHRAAVHGWINKGRNPPK
jgi:hypothetical protein